MPLLFDATEGSLDGQSLDIEGVVIHEGRAFLSAEAGQTGHLVAVELECTD